MLNAAQRAIIFGKAGWCFQDSSVDIDFVAQRCAVKGYPRSLQNSLSLTRTTVGMAQWGAGNWTTFASGALRITDKGALIEVRADNRVLYSRDLTNAAWVATTMTTALTSTGIDNAANSATRLTATGALAMSLQTVGSLASVARRFSMFIKRVTGTGAVGISVDGITFPDISGSLSTTAWYRAELAVAAAASVVCGVQLATSGDVVDVDFAQLEDTNGAALTYSTSPILTTSAAVTRNLDNLTLTGQALSAALGGVAATTFAQASLYAEYIYHSGNGTSLGAGGWGISGNAERLRLTSGSTDIAGLITTSGGASVASPVTTGAMVEGTVYKHAAAAASTDYAVVRGGGTVGTAATAGNFPTGMTTVQLGGITFGGASLNSYLRRFAVWPGIRKTNADLQAMTT